MSTQTPIRYGEHPSSEALDVVAIPGSLRSGSYNRALARSLRDLAPEGVEVEVVELHDVPLYNGDLDDDRGRPEGVVRLKERLRRADGAVFVTPEYNYGVPGVLKNALDWASRPAFRSPLTELPVGLMGASPGAGGTMRAQEQLKLDLMAVLARVYPHPGVAVTRVAGKVADGTLTHDDTRDFVGDYLEGYAEWVRTVREPSMEAA